MEADQQCDADSIADSLSPLTATISSWLRTSNEYYAQSAETERLALACDLLTQHLVVLALERLTQTVHRLRREARPHTRHLFVLLTFSKPREGVPLGRNDLFAGHKIVSLVFGLVGEGLDTFRRLQREPTLKRVEKALAHHPELQRDVSAAIVTVGREAQNEVDIVLELTVRPEVIARLSNPVPLLRC